MQFLLVPLLGVLLLDVTQHGGAQPGPYCLPIKKELRLQEVSFTARAIDGAAVAFSSSAGHPQIIGFFATWCRPCNQEMPAFMNLVHQYASRGVAAMLVDDREPPQKVETFARSFGIDVPIVIDSDGSISHMFGTRAVPTTLFYSGKGALTCFVVDQLDPRQLDNEASAALQDWTP